MGKVPVRLRPGPPGRIASIRGPPASIGIVPTSQAKEQLQIRIRRACAEIGD